MTFGVLFGAAFLCMLRYLPKRGFKNGFANAVLGLFVYQSQTQGALSMKWIILAIGALVVVLGGIAAMRR